ncbi:KH domain-containing, RNA-binding, signal transduction-associated protein 3 isoform X8 [Kogia breviceps]|uniref:KH domain-containing, RNA-binding, signal transduction-associated protein 3 isoform X8 n=1 Tax=Kogia breviceps TaxID=27615 RepID=UPI0034D1C791
MDGKLSLPSREQPFIPPGSGIRVSEKAGFGSRWSAVLWVTAETLSEIEKFHKGEGKDDEKYIDVVINKNMKLGQKVLIPVKQFPKFNFVGKLLGPRGNSLKRLQEETLTKMSILGKGSMRDKAKEEELRKSGEAKYFHLNDDLHVLIEVFAPPAEAYARMGHALEEIKKFLIPDYNDEIRQAQLQELTYLNGGSENADVPVVRGKPTLRTRGVPTPAITRTMMTDMALLTMNRVMIPMITAIAPQPKVVLITMIMDTDSVKRLTIPTETLAILESERKVVSVQQPQARKLRLSDVTGFACAPGTS